MTVIGLDIGGANLKAAHLDGVARTVPFPLWREPARLPAALAALLASLPPADTLAITMTGELCDCFESRHAGVLFILDAVAEILASRRLLVWTIDGTFVDGDTARQAPLRVAAVNWLALAGAAAPLAGPGPALLIDVGSTTTDLVPLLDGRPCPRAFTDPERMLRGELVYTGVRRTPLCAVLGFSAAGELFATTHDAYLALGMCPENPNDHGTADGRPATNACAHARLARMLCSDAATVTPEQTRCLAEQAFRTQVHCLAQTADMVAATLPAPPRKVIASGSGAWLVPPILRSTDTLAGAGLIALPDIWSPPLAEAACAYALTLLASSTSHAAPPREHLPATSPSPPGTPEKQGWPSPSPSPPGTPGGDCRGEGGKHPARSLPPPASRVVVKIGGSLYDLPDLGPRLRDFLASFQDRQVLLVPGGGALAEGIRALDRTHSLGDEAAHWLALEALRVNAGFLANVLTNVPILESLDALDAQPCVLVDMASFASDDERNADALPHLWDVTSDSLAVRLACRAGATECVLLKSAPCPELSWEEAAQLQLVDRYFPHVMEATPPSLRVRLHCMRNR